MTESAPFANSGFSDCATSGFSYHRADHADFSEALITIRDVAHMSKVHLLESLLEGTGRRADLVAVSLISRYGDLQRIFGADIGELIEIAGSEGALRLKVVLEAATRYHREPLAKRDLISSWSELLRYLVTSMAGEPREVFRVLFLDTKNGLILDEAMGRGTLNHCPTYPREIVRRALEVGASNILIAHNHPSGDPTPSRPDIEMTEKIVVAAKALGITVHDHCIVGGTNVVSFKKLGLL